MKLPVLLIFLLLAACSTTSERPAVKPPVENVKREFETAIAGEIIASVRQELPALHGPAKRQFLREKLAQFNSSVDLALVTGHMVREYTLLDYLARSEDARIMSSDFIQRVNAMASVTWTAARYQKETADDLTRLAKRILENAAASDIDDHMQAVRNQATYPDDSIEGRQRYLDNLAEAMFDLQIDWYDLLNYYDTSSMGLYGEESTDFLFRYNHHPSTGGELTINLASVENLPLFELKPLAAFYGFPGLEVINAGGSLALQSQLDLPGYSHGWASYMVASIGARDKEPLPFLYFERMLTALAHIDMQLALGQLTADQASNYLLNNTPYTASRARLMVQAVRDAPGLYLAAFAGKRTFMELKAACESRGGECEAVFNQVVADLGVAPFELLSEYLRGQP